MLRPSRRLLTRPAERSTVRCCDTADCVTALANVRAPTVCSPLRARRSKTARRVGSAKTPKRSSVLTPDTLASTNALVNTNEFGPEMAIWRSRSFLGGVRPGDLLARRRNTSVNLLDHDVTSGFTVWSGSEGVMLLR